MASFRLPSNLGLLQGVALGYPYLFPFGSDQPRVYFTDTESGEEIWSDAKIMTVSNNPEALVMQHPTETGTSIMDHRVIMPIETSVRLILEKDVYRDVYSSIQEYNQSAKLVDIHTRTGINSNMAIVAFPHEEDPEIFDAILIEIHFREMIFVSPSQGTMTQENTRNKADSNTVQQGQKTPSLTSINTNAQQEALDWRLKGGGS